MMKKNTPVPVDDIQQVSLDDETVKLLYQYVTGEMYGKRIMKFVTESNVDLSSFSDQEKIEFALRFADADDFSFTEEFNDKKQKIYTLPDQTLKKYMTYYFGSSVTYTPVEEIKYPFMFSINKMNEGTLTYNQIRGGYDAVFASQFDFDANKSMIDPVYGQLTGATRKKDGSYILQERVVYTELRTDGGGYAVDIYKDSEKKELLDTKTGLNDESLNQFQIHVSEYPNTTLVEYHFGLENSTLYFKSSRIIA